MARQGVLVEPYHRLRPEQVEQIHQASLTILTGTGVLCFNRYAVEVFRAHRIERFIEQEVDCDRRYTGTYQGKCHPGKANPE
jgi:trimethylamine:corrinoid methyltransferase-like protein